VDGGGSIDANGVFTAGATAGGPYTVTATLGPETATAVVTVAAVNAPPTVATPAAASPSPATGTTTTLSVLGDDDAGEDKLIYTWAAVGTPPAPVTFSVNGTNAAKSTVATFVMAGEYTFEVTIADAHGATVTSTVVVTVNQTLTTIVVSPPSAIVAPGATQAFTAAGSDQFGNPLAISPVWSVTGGAGLITQSGVFVSGVNESAVMTQLAADDKLCIIGDSVSNVVACTGPGFYHQAGAFYISGSAVYYVEYRLSPESELIKTMLSPFGSGTINCATQHTPQLISITHPGDWTPGFYPHPNYASCSVVTPKVAACPDTPLLYSRGILLSNVSETFSYSRPNISTNWALSGATNRTYAVNPVTLAGPCDFTRRLFDETLYGDFESIAQSGAVSKWASLLGMSAWVLPKLRKTIGSNLVTNTTLLTISGLATLNYLQDTVDSQPISGSSSGWIPSLTGATGFKAYLVGTGYYITVIVSGTWTVNIPRNGTSGSITFSMSSGLGQGVFVDIELF
jgi:hypothetical protein